VRQKAQKLQKGAAKRCKKGTDLFFVEENKSVPFSDIKNQEIKWK
jgi:hypothetical protein